MTLERHEDSERVLLSYDLAGEARLKAARVCQIVFGRVRGRLARLGTYGRRKGFIHRPGLFWTGQSALAMAPRDAEELRLKLGSCGVPVALARIEVSREAFETFRRPRKDDGLECQPRRASCRRAGLPGPAASRSAARCGIPQP